MTARLSSNATGVLLDHLVGEREQLRRKNDRLGSEAVPGLSTFFENAAIHGEMRLVDCTGLALRLFQQRRRWNRRMINEMPK
jgi:hypothetical protein